MRRLTRTFAVAAGTVLLASCAMGPDYERPVTDSPESWRVESLPGESFANLDWWDMFDDPLMVELIERALLNNKDMAIAAARIEEARASLGFVRADPVSYTHLTLPTKIV